jgi:hypothetical protein
MYEYKVIPAPARVQKVKGLKTTQERFAHLVAELLNQHGADGWEYLRAESLPCEERKGLTGLRSSTQTVLILRRAIVRSESAGAPEETTLRQVPSISPAALRPQPVPSTPSLRAARDVPPLRAPVPSIGEQSPAVTEAAPDHPQPPEDEQTLPPRI